MDFEVNNVTVKEQRKYVKAYNFPFCDDISKHEKVIKIGQGSFG